MKNIAKAIIKVMSNVKGMEKNSRVGGNSRSAYDGTKDQDVKEIFNNALEKAGLCIVPIGIEPKTQIDRWEAKDYNGNPTTKQSVFTEVKTKYLLIHAESGESVELEGYGHGVDPQDKGAGKATTYALKNCLLYTFLTPVGKIDDTDLTHSKDIQQVPTKAKMSDAKLKATADKLAKGAVTLQKVKDHFELTQEQEDRLIELSIK